MMPAFADTLRAGGAALERPALDVIWFYVVCVLVALGMATGMNEAWRVFFMERLIILVRVAPVSAARWLVLGSTCVLWHGAPPVSRTAFWTKATVALPSSIAIPMPQLLGRPPLQGFDRAAQWCSGSGQGQAKTIPITDLAGNRCAASDATTSLAAQEHSWEACLDCHATEACVRQALVVH